MNVAAHADILRLISGAECRTPGTIGVVDRFHARHPDLRCSVLADHYIDLSKGKADVALRSGDTEGELVGRKIADSVWALRKPPLSGAQRGSDIGRGPEAPSADRTQ